MDYVHSKQNQSPAKHMVADTQASRHAALNLIPLKRIGLPLVWLVLVMLFIRQLGDPSIGYPDADRFLMDGVFMLDFLRDMPLSRVYDYTVHYYAQYPALSVGYHPPFFPFVEGLLNGIFGINTWSSRLAVLLFMAAGIAAWYLLVARTFDHTAAFFSSMLFVSTPFVAQWGWYTMSDLPVLAMVLATGYMFYRYTESDQPRYIYWAALFFGAAVWTKQPAVFMGVWFALYMLVTGKFFAYLKRREIWIALALLGVAIVPLAVVTVWLGKANIAQSLGSAADSQVSSRWSWSNLSFYPTQLFTSQLSLPVFALSLVGLAIGGWKRDRRLLFFIALIVSTYLFYTFLMAKEARYTLSWLPAFCLLAVLPVFYFRTHKRVKMALMAILVVTTLYQVNAVYAKIPHYATGYDEAARYVIAHSKSPTVFFDGYNNGYFTYFVRQLDPQRSMYVLRGDKLLSSSAISARTWLTVHAHTPAEIRAIFDKYGIVYIVVERDNLFGIPIHQTLRDYLKSDDFRLLKTIPVQSNRSVLKGQQLLIYQYLTPKALTASSLVLDLPVVGKTITVPMRSPVDASQP